MASAATLMPDLCVIGGEICLEESGWSLASNDDVLYSA